jgi:hypothetical protein
MYRRKYIFIIIDNPSKKYSSFDTIPLKFHGIQIEWGMLSFIRVGTVPYLSYICMCTR